MTTTVHTTAIYEGTPGARLQRPGVELLGSSAEALVRTAADAVERGATRIELCGGVGVADAARVRDALPPAVAVRLVRYGFESLQRIAAFQQDWAADRPVGRQLFLVHAPGADPVADQVEHPDAVVIPVPDPAAAAEAAARVHTRHSLGLIELYGGLGIEVAAAVRAATGEQVPVGFIDA